MRIGGSSRSGRAATGTLALIAALALAACGGGGDDTSSATTYDGSWTGTTSQGKPVSFTVAGGVVTAFSIAWDYGGSQCTILVSKVKGPEKTPISDGKAKLKDRGVDLSFDSATKASGTGNFPPDPASKPYCKTADITLKAQRSGS
jgi:hypothetical protein